MSIIIHTQKGSCGKWPKWTFNQVYSRDTAHKRYDSCINGLCCYWKHFDILIPKYNQVSNKQNNLKYKSRGKWYFKVILQVSCQIMDAGISGIGNCGSHGLATGLSPLNCSNTSVTPNHSCTVFFLSVNSSTYFHHVICCHDYYYYYSTYFV